MTAILIFAFILVKKDRIDVIVILVHIFSRRDLLEPPEMLTSPLVQWPLWFVAHGGALRMYMLFVSAFVLVK